jgi:hypothetical protein
VYVASLAEALPDFWVSWVQGGAAVQALMDSLTDPLERLPAITRSRVFRGEIVWVGGQFAVTQADFDREGKADFYLLREARRAKFMGKRAVPIVDVIDKVDLPKIMIDTIKRILTPAGLSHAPE